MAPAERGSVPAGGDSPGEVLGTAVGRQADDVTERVLPPLTVLAGGRIRLAAAAATGGTAAVVAALIGPLDEATIALVPAFLVLGMVSGVAFWVDLLHRVIPNRLNLAGAIAMPAALTIASLAGIQGSMVRALLGGFAAFLVYLILAVIAPAGMGMGDVKLAPTLGMMLGYISWGALRVGLVWGFVIQGVLAVGLLAAGRVGRKGKIAHGPAMVVGTLVAIALS